MLNTVVLPTMLKNAAPTGVANASPNTSPVRRSTRQGRCVTSPHNHQRHSHSEQHQRRYAG